MKKTRSSNPNLVKLIEELKKKAYAENAPIWRDLAKRLSRSSKRRAEINISRLSRYTKENDIVVVSGKILSSGTINHAITAAAFGFSKQAKEKISAAGGECISIIELMNRAPKGTNVIIME